MQRQILPGLRMTFIAHVIVALIFGLAWLIIPDRFGELFGGPVQEPLAWRVIGAATLAFGASSWWAWHEVEWERVKIIVETEIVWTVLATLIYLYAVLGAGYPASFWLGVILMAAFFVAFGYFYTRQGAAAIQPAPR
jgi:hypothetical protein